MFMKPGNKQQLITESELADDTCQTRDPFFAVNQVSELLQDHIIPRPRPGEARPYRIMALPGEVSIIIVDHK